MPLTAKEIMETKLITVDPETPLTEVSDLLFRHGITGAPVVKSDKSSSPGAVLGVISRSDLVRFPLYQDAVEGILSEYFRELEAAEGETDAAPDLPGPIQEVFAEHTAREAMAPVPVVVEPNTPVREVARAMASHHIHRALVVDNDTLVGLISALDIVELVAEGRDL